MRSIGACGFALVWFWMISVPAAEPAYVREIRMERVSWARPLHGGPLKLLCVMGPRASTNNCTRDGHELALRMDLQCQQIAKGRKAGVRDLEQLRAVLVEDSVDVYAFGSLGQEGLPPDVLLLLLEKIRAGKGVLVAGANPFGEFNREVLFQKHGTAAPEWTGYTFGQGRIAVAG